MAVIAAIELEDRVASGVCAGDPNRAHDRFRARTDETDPLHRGKGLHDHLGERDLQGRRRAIARPACRRPGDRLDDRRGSMPEDHRPPGHHIVHKSIAVSVVQASALGTGDERRLDADRLKSANGAVHTARHEFLGGLEELF